MHPPSTRRALGFDDASVARAREAGHVVGRGEGFVSREWRAGRPLLSVHTNAEDAQVECVVPFVAGFARRAWTLVGVRANACVHCTCVHLRAGSLEVMASIPDYAARRRMLPVGLAVQASVVVVVDEWRRGEALDRLIAPVEGGETGSVVVSGRIASTASIANEATGQPLVACELVDGDGGFFVVGPSIAIADGETISATGRALARVGAPVRSRPLA